MIWPLLALLVAPLALLWHWPGEIISVFPWFECVNQWLKCKDGSKRKILPMSWESWSVNRPSSLLILDYTEPSSPPAQQRCSYNKDANHQRPYLIEPIWSIQRRVTDLRGAEEPGANTRLVRISGERPVLQNKFSVELPCWVIHHNGYLTPNSNFLKTYR